MELGICLPNLFWEFIKSMCIAIKLQNLAEMFTSIDILCLSFLASCQQALHVLFSLKCMV